LAVTAAVKEPVFDRAVDLEPAEPAPFLPSLFDICHSVK